MKRRVGHTLVESIAAESPKFTAPLVLVHGLWCTAVMWRPFMGYFAHRGWTCYALNLRGHTEPSEDIVCQAHCADYLADVRQVIAACEAPPVIVGHDLGGLLALQSSASGVRAVVALAPLVPGALATTSNRALSSFATRLAVLRSLPLGAPRGRLGAAYFAQGAPGGTVSESPRVAREVQRDDFDLPSGATVPTLVLAGSRDSFCLPGDLRRVAARVGAAFRIAEGGGHALPWEPGWERRVSEIHRWLVHTLGETLLLPRDGEEE